MRRDPGRRRRRSSTATRCSRCASPCRPEDQKRIDASLLPALESGSQGGQAAPGAAFARQDADRDRERIQRDAGRACWASDAPYLPGGRAAGQGGRRGRPRQGRRGADRARAQAQDDGQAARSSVYKALGTLGGPTAVKFLQDKVRGGDKEEALLATRALGERRDPAVLPFALKVAADPKARQDAARRDVRRHRRDRRPRRREGAGSGSSRRTRTRSSATAPSNRCSRRARPTGIQPGLEAFPASATLQEGRRRRSAGEADREAGRDGPAGAGQDAGVARAAGAHDRGDGAGADRAARPTRRRWRSWPATRAPVKGFPAGRDRGQTGGARRREP